MGSPRKTVWLVPRRLLRQQLFEVPESLPPSKRRSALNLLVRRWAPFADTQFAAQWVGHRASVYAWDNAKAIESMTEAGLRPAICTVHPEPFYRAAGDHGARVATMADGYEGQVWRDGLLVGSRWWPNTPDSLSWTMFQRGSGLAPQADGAPEGVQLPLIEIPWHIAREPLEDIFGIVQNRQFVAIAAAVVAAPFLYLGGETVAFSIAEGRLQSATSALAAANQSVRGDRAGALSNLDVIDAYQGLEPYPPQFALIAEATRLLQPRNVSITDWTFDSGNLELSIHSQLPLDATFYIEMFERSPLFSGVGGTTANQEHDLRLKMQVDRQAWTGS